MYGENTKTIAIPIYRVLPYPVIIIIISVVQLGRFCFLMLLCFCLPVTQPTVVINTIYSGLINAGNNFTLNAEIIFSDPTVVDVILLALNWSRDDVLIASNDRISVSSVSTSESGYTASLTYSPIATSDSGLITATVTVSPSDDSILYTVSDSYCSSHPQYSRYDHFRVTVKEYCHIICLLCLICINIYIDLNESY